MIFLIKNSYFFTLLESLLFSSWIFRLPFNYESQISFFLNSFFIFWEEERQMNATAARLLLNLKSWSFVGLLRKTFWMILWDFGGFLNTFWIFKMNFWLFCFSLVLIDLKLLRISWESAIKRLIRYSNFKLTVFLNKTHFQSKKSN